MAAAFDLRILSAERDFFSGPCVSLTLPARGGQLGILARHSPIVAAVEPGVLRYRLPDGTEAAAAAGGGLLRFENNAALLLVDSVEPAEA